MSSFPIAFIEIRMKMDLKNRIWPRDIEAFKAPALEDTSASSVMDRETEGEGRLVKPLNDLEGFINAQGIC
jgi:hypothetical protein